MDFLSHTLKIGSAIFNDWENTPNSRNHTWIYKTYYSETRERQRDNVGGDSSVQRFFGRCVDEEEAVRWDLGVQGFFKRFADEEEVRPGFSGVQVLWISSIYYPVATWRWFDWVENVSPHFHCHLFSPLMINKHYYDYYEIWLARCLRWRRCLNNLNNWRP